MRRLLSAGALALLSVIGVRDAAEQTPARESGGDREPEVVRGCGSCGWFTRCHHTREWVTSVTGVRG